MSILNKIKIGSGDLPPRVLLSGPEGIGKSTFASKAPSPLFIASEDGLTGLDHVKRFSPTTLPELHQILDELQRAAGEFKTVVVDTTDWLERFLATEVCKRDGQENIESYGYGKGYVVLENELVKLLQRFDLLRSEKRMGIVLLSHVQIRTFTDPRGMSFDRFEMKGHKRFTGILREWPDASLFAVFEVFKVKDKAERREKTIGGERIMHTTWSPAWDAKNRLNLPETLPLDWDAFESAVQANSPASLRKRVTDLFATAQLPDKEKWSKALDPAKLASMSPDRLTAAIDKLTAAQPK